MKRHNNNLMTRPKFYCEFKKPKLNINLRVSDVISLIFFIIKFIYKHNTEYRNKERESQRNRIGHQD